jgi:hypothetical protein
VRKGGEKMNKIRKTNVFKFTALLLIFLFIFQADFLLANKETDHEKQYKLAEKEFKKGKDENYKNAKKKLEFLLGILDEKDKKQAQLLKKVKNLLKEIEIRLKLHIIEKEGKKKKFPVLLVVAGIAVVVVVAVLMSKKKKEPQKYTLTVTKGEGVDGSPNSGTMTYNQGTAVNYNYSLQSGYKDLQVRLDGNAVSSSGTITMDRDHTLTATATPLDRYTLTVTKGEGVVGTPDSGTTTYDEGTVVNYSYSLQSGYTNLGVTLDGATVPCPFGKCAYGLKKFFFWGIGFSASRKHPQVSQFPMNPG